MKWEKKNQLIRHKDLTTVHINVLKTKIPNWIQRSQIWWKCTEKLFSLILIENSKIFVGDLGFKIEAILGVYLDEKVRCYLTFNFNPKV